MKKRFHQFISQFHTLRLRLILATLAIGLIPYTIAALAFTGLYEENALSSEEQRISAQVQPLAHNIQDNGYLNDPSSQEINERIDVMQLLYEGRVLVLNDSLKIVHDSSGIDEGRTLLWDNAVRALQGDTLYYYDKENAYLTVTVPIVRTTGEKDISTGVFMVVRSMDYMEQNLLELRYAGIIGFVILAILIVLAAISISSRTTKPLKEMGTSLEKIKEGMGQGELHVRAFKEIEDLEDQFNDFLDEMQTFDESRQEFVSNVSHELKTPLTSMKVLADSLEGMTDAPVELYQEFMHDMSSEIDRETKIINDLLSLVRMNKSGVVMNIASVNMNDLVESILKRLRPIAMKAHVEVVMESFRPVNAEIDETKLSLAITNLVENAIKYNNQDGSGWVHVSLNADHQYCYLRVEDNGMGMPEESLAHIFERFYRVDKSHSREIGGTGLGLAITHDAVRMHHGEIKVHSKLGSGTTFDVRIPLKYIPDPEEDVTVKAVKPTEASAETKRATEAEISAEEKLTEARENMTSEVITVADTQKIDREAIHKAMQEQEPLQTEPVDINDIDDTQPLDTDFPSEEEIDKLMAQEDFIDDDEDEDQ